MSARALLASAIALVGAACLVLVPHAGAARAATVNLESYRTFGVARGAEFSFTFKGSLFEPLLHIGIPFARAGIKSEAGATSDATAGQVYPGDLISSQAGDQFPGVATASYPPGRDVVKDVAPFPGAGPVSAQAGHVVAEADPTHALSDVTTAGAGFTDGDVPLLSVGSVHVRSEGRRTDDGVIQVVRSVVKDVELDLAEDFAIRIGSVVSTAEALSDGMDADAEGRLTVTDAVLVLGGQEFPATIDDQGIRVAEPLQDLVGAPLQLDQAVNAGLRQLGVSITTAGPVSVVDGSTAEAAVGGLVIGLTGEIPVVPVPRAFAQLISSVRNELPPEVTDPFCFQDDLDPSFPLPLCLGINFLPGPGSGMVQTLSLGNVNAIVGASQAPPPVDDGGDPPDGDGGSFPDVPVDTPTDVGSPPPPGDDTGDGGAPAGPTQLTGLVARMPAGALLGAAFGLFVLAAGVSLLPTGRKESG